MKLYEIGHDLYVSGWPEPTPANLALLDEKCVSWVMCLSKKVTADAVHEGCGFTYHPIPDGKTLPLEDLRVLVSQLLKHLDDGEIVLVHCLQGRNRSMITALLAEKKRRHWTGLETYAHAQLVRPHCLHNPVFADFLRSLP